MKKTLFLFNLFIISFFSFSQTDSALHLFFDVDRHQLGKDHINQLNGLIKTNISITCIKGFADSTGNIAYNKELSKKRANAVYVYLKKLQVVSSTIKIEYLGEQEAPGEDIFYNRRVDVCYEASTAPVSMAKEESTVENKIENEEKKTDSPVITKRYELSNIYFVPDKAIIESWSFYAVDDAAKYLKNFPGCKFEIIGHVNYILSPAAMKNPKALEPAQRLSEERAKTVYDLLIEREIPSANMTYKGVGNSQLIFKSPKNDDEKRKNMRVEILIYCNK